MMSKVDLTPEVQETVTVSNKLTTAVTANGTIRTTEQATVYVSFSRILLPCYFLETLRRTCVFV